MTDRAHRAPRPLAALARTAAVLMLLAGVLAMHALTVGHRPTPDTRTPAVPVAAPHAEQVMGVAQQQPSADTAPMGAHDPAAAHVAAGAETADGCADCGGHPAPAHSGAHLLDLCVAILLAATLTVLLMLWARARRSTRAVRSPAAGRVVGRRLSGALRPLPLSMLCVLRT